MSAIFQSIAADELAGQPTDQPEIFLDAGNDFDFDEGFIGEAIDGIEVGLEAIQQIAAIQKTVAETKDTTGNTMRLGVIAVEDIKHQLGIFTGQKVVLESIDTPGVALEGFTSAIKRIWDAIVNTFKSVWDAIMRFFGRKRVEKQTEEINKVVEKVNKEVKVNPEKKKAVTPTVKFPKDGQRKQSFTSVAVNPTMSHVVADMTFADTAKDLVHKLSFIGNDLNAANLSGHANSVVDTVSSLIKFCDRIHSSAIAMHSIVEHLPTDVSDGKGLDDKLIDSIGKFGEIYATIPSDISGKTKVNDIHRHDNELFAQIGLHVRDIDAANVYGFGPFNFGRSYVLFTLHDPDGDIVHEQHLTKWRAFYTEYIKNDCTVTFGTWDEAVHYSETVLQATDKINEQSVRMFEILKKVRSFQEQAMHKTSRIFDTYTINENARGHAHVMVLTHIVKNFLELLSHVYKLERNSSETLTTHRGFVLDVCRKFLK